MTDLCPACGSSHDRGQCPVHQPAPIDDKAPTPHSQRPELGRRVTVGDLALAHALVKKRKAVNCLCRGTGEIIEITPPAGTLVERRYEDREGGVGMVRATLSDGKPIQRYCRRAIDHFGSLFGRSVYSEGTGALAATYWIKGFEPELHESIVQRAGRFGLAFTDVGDGKGAAWRRQ